MPGPSSPHSYEPNAALRALYSKVFDSIQVDPAWVSEVKRLAAKGTVAYVLRNLNVVDFLALDHFTRRHGLPRIQFVNDLGLGLLNPLQRSWLEQLLPKHRGQSAEDLREAVAAGASVAIFLKRRPGVLDVAAGASGGRGLKEGEELTRTLIDLQRERATPILLVPQVFVWTKFADSRGKNPLDWVLGPREWPSLLRTVGQLLVNRKHVTLRLGEPLDLQAYLGEGAAASDAVNVRRITYTLLRRLERERRAITGPAGTPPDRVRHEVLRSPKLRAVIDELAGENPHDRHVLTLRAFSLLHELQATPNMSAVMGLGALFHRVFNHIYAGIDYDPAELDRLREAAKEGTLVLLPSHKSHIDYLVLSYVFHQRNLQIPLIAAGDNLNFFPLGAVFRRGGAFFIRRSFKGDRLYQAVVSTYVRRLLRHGYPIELFIEGGRSRTGKLLAPKFGLLGMLVEAALEVSQRPTWFVPVSIGYDRVVETGSYERELGGGEKTKEDASGLLKSTEVLRHRYGRINLQFGELLGLQQLREELHLPAEGELPSAARHALTTRLGNRTMDEINRVTAVTPGALTALTLLAHGRRGIEHEQLVEHARRLLTVLRELGARLPPSLATETGSLRAESLREALQMFITAEMVALHTPEGEPGGGRRAPRAPLGPGVLYSVPDAKRLAVDTSKNMVVHFFVERALVALAVLVPPRAPTPLPQVRERVFHLSRLFKYEFRFQADQSFDAIFTSTVEAMLQAGELEWDAERRVTVGPGRLGWKGREWLEQYASILRNFLEGYRVAARGLALLVKGPLTKKELIKRCLELGQRLLLQGEIDRREAVSKPLLQNALLAFLDQGYLVELEGKLSLAPSFATPPAVSAIERRISTFLDRRASS